MSGVKHTPGPWRIDANGSANWTVDYEGPSSTYMPICANGRREPVGFAVEPTAWGNDDEIEANARLIAAAPDLLEALSRAAHSYDGFPPRHCPAWMDQARAAVARARGEQDGGGS